MGSFVTKCGPLCSTAILDDEQYSDSSPKKVKSESATVQGTGNVMDSCISNMEDPNIKRKVKKGGDQFKSKDELNPNLLNMHLKGAAKLNEESSGLHMAKSPRSELIDSDKRINASFNKS